MVQVLDWLNENELRAYPLQEGYEKIIPTILGLQSFPHNFLLDLQLKTSVSFDEPAVIYLKTVKYSSGDSLEISFGNADNNLFQFTISSVAEKVYPLYVRTAEGNLAVFGEGTKTVLSWVPAETEEDYIVTVDAPVEAAVCIQFNDAWLGVNTLSASPAKQTKQELGEYGPTSPLISLLSPISLSGDVKLLGGYNFRVAVADNLLDLEISDSYGLRMNCNTAFIPSEYLDCKDLVSYINGIPPDSKGNFRINQGSNVDIISGTAIDASPDPAINMNNKHTLFVGLSFQATDLCAPINLSPTTTT